MPDIPRKFYRLVKVGRPEKEMKKWEKIYGKRKAKELGLYEKFCTADCSFISAGSFLTHIKKHNDSIEVLSYEKYRELVDEKQLQQVAA
jgi:UDP-N-acetylglucosamine transferase subunit ALG13